MLSVGVYGLRALYFAVMEKGNIPLVYTGTAVGLISIIGYAPDIFSGPLAGYFLDQYPWHSRISIRVCRFGCYFRASAAWAGWKYHVMYGKS